MNTFIESNKGKHFTLSDRISIEAGIEKGWSFKKIADELGKSPSSVSREVRHHLIFSPHYYDDRSRRKTECIYFSSCSKQGVCGNLSCSSLCSKCRSRKCASFCLIWKIFPAVSVLFIPTWISSIFLLSTLTFPEKSATKNVKRNSLIHRFPDIERTVLTEISWIFLLLPPILQ